jgi:hypothetical protein
MLINAERCLSSIVRVSTFTDFTPSSADTFLMTSSLILPRIGQAAIVRATPTVTEPSGEIDTDWTIPRSTMSLPSSGSRTPLRAVMMRASFTDRSVDANFHYVDGGYCS